MMIPCPKCDNMGMFSTMEPNYTQLSGCWSPEDTYMIFERSWFCFNCGYVHPVKERVRFNLFSVEVLK